jgi:YVTN family beta-propeller protein
MVEFRILGPLEVVERDQPVLLGGPRQRALLAVLLLHRGQVVSTDRLIDEVWGERPPATAAKAVQVNVSSLRKALGDGLLVTRGHGYLLQPELGQVDLDRFEALAAEGRQALGEGDARRAGDRLREALALWRGPPLADFAYEPFAQAATARLEEERLTALEDRIDADLELGRHAALVGELEALVREHPLRERLHAQLMLGLYRSGRQADALEHYQRARRRLIDELGIEPAPELQGLERAILNHDPALDAAHRPLKPAVSGRAGRLLALGGMLLVLAAAAAALEVLGDRGGNATPTISSADSVGLVSPAGTHPKAPFPVGVNPSTVVVGAGAVWVLNADDHTVTRIDLASHAERTYGTNGIPLDLAAGDGSLWVVIGARTHGAVLTGARAPFVVPTSVLRLDPVTILTLATIPLSQAPPAGPPPFYEIAFGPQGLWVINADASVSRIDTATNRVVHTIRNLHPLAIASGAEGAWVIEGGPTTSVARLSSDGDQVTQRVQVPALSLSGSIALGAGAVWITDPNEGELWRIDPSLGSVERTIPLAPGVSDVAYGAGAVWVTNTQTGTVSRIDPRTNRVTETIRIGNTPGRLTVGGGGIWVIVSTTHRVPVDASVPTEATVATLLQQHRCLRAPVLWTAIKSHCVYRTGPLAP